MFRENLKGQRRTAEGGREWQKIAMDGDDSLRGWNRQSDVTPNPQGTKGEEAGTDRDARYYHAHY